MSRGPSLRRGVSLRRALALGVLAALVAPSLAARDEHPFETDALREPTLKTGGSCLVRGATIHTAQGAPFVGDVLVLDGRIAGVGEVGAQEGIVEIDAAGRHLAPGAVDCHSHLAIEGGLNEDSVAIAAEVRVDDALDADDIAIYRALAGGATTARLLHGSADPIGGQDATIKLKWGRRPAELRFPGAPRGIKFALGENPKRSNRPGPVERFPATRMGVEALFTRAFERAREYQREWAAYVEARDAGDDPLPPRRDLRLEALAGVLDGELAVHCHCYRSDGILMMLRQARYHGFRIGTLQHVLEGYKVAVEMARAGVPGSTFADWWSFKVEAYDAIPQNAALMQRAGVLVSLNSDSDEVVRRLYGEAAKSARYAGMSRDEALKLVTLHPARQLGIDDRVGSIEVGKDADLVLLDGPPLSSLSRVEWTMVDGEIEFQRRDAFGLDAAPLAAPPLPAASAPALAPDPQGGAVYALTGGTVHPIDAAPIEGGTVLFQDGVLLAVGPEVTPPPGAVVIPVAGQHVWPGLIALNTALGLREIGAVRATVDTAEIGGDQPDLRASAAVHADSAHIGVTRYNGITRAQVAPQGGGPVLGQSGVIDLDGDTQDELVFVDRDMLHVRVPRVANDAEDDAPPDELVELRALFEAAREHARRVEAAQEAGAPPPRSDPRLAALAPYARGEERVALHADNARTILVALELAAEQQLDAVLFGAREGWKVVDAVAAAGLPVVVGPVLALPTSRFDPYDAPYANAAVLARAGVPVAIQSADQENPRNLVFHAAMAAAFGLPQELALRAITLEPARVLGLDDRLGSLAPGKRADVIVTSGPLLEIDSRVERMFIDGREVDLEDNHQSRLRARYSARLERLRAEER